MFLKLCWAFLKVGVLGFGSGPAMLVLIEREMRDLGVMGSGEFADAVAMSTALPGPLATKMALYCGYAAGGTVGAFGAITAMLLPSSIAVLLLARFVMQFKDQPQVAAALKAMRPVVVAIFLFLAVNSARGIKPSWDLIAIGVAALVLLILRVDPAWVILGAVVLGLLVY